MRCQLQITMDASTIDWDSKIVNATLGWYFRPEK